MSRALMLGRETEMIARSSCSSDCFGLEIPLSPKYADLFVQVWSLWSCFVTVFFILQQLGCSDHDSSDSAMLAFLKHAI